MFEIVPPEERTLDVTSLELVRQWRKSIGPLPGARELSFRAEIGRGGDPVDIQLSGTDFEKMASAAEKVKDWLAKYPGVFDITDSLDEGKEEIELSIKPEAELLGLKLADLGRQVRNAFFGSEAQRIQRGRDDVRVMVRYPESERRSLASLEMMKLRAPGGAEVPFYNVAEVKTGRSFSAINRVDRKRTLNIRADINKKTVNSVDLNSDIKEYLSGLLRSYPGVNYSLEGEAREQSKSFGSLFSGILFVLFVMYALLAIPFKSYLQPLIVMSVIPFGLIGAIIGHFIIGIGLSMLSIFGMLALTGVVVNDSLVMVDYVNRRRKEGIALADAVQMAGVARFRAILLTSLTTFCGLVPLIFEKSTQAQFLIPMAVSLGFGVLVATVFTLFLVPASYMILEDFKRGFWKIYG